MNYWGYRIDVRKRDYLFQEIKNGRLRQGWGYNENQNLKGEEIDVSAQGNLPILNRVKKGDILLVPRIESWDEIAIVEATEDFDTGYKFSIDPEVKDYGHIFPVEFKRCFSRHNINVDGAIRETLKCRSRFWNINRCEEEIKKILQTPEEEIRSSSNYEERFRRRVETAFDEDRFANRMYDELNKDAQSSEWEYVLCEGFRRLFPDSYSVEPTSNKIEKKHGADIIIRIPGILNTSYIIAIQVKDHSGIIDKTVVDQICKSDGYFEKEENAVLIDKYLIIIRAKPEDNRELIESAEKNNVKILFGDDVKDLLSKMARSFISDGLFSY